MQQTTRSGPLRMGFHLGLPGPVHAWLSPCLVALTLLAGAGCGGSGGGSSSSGGTTPGVISTGTVSLAMSDTPFADLQTFTLELSRATLKGAGTAADLQLFPVGGTQASSLDVDMLQLIGVNRLLGTAQVPVGIYYGVELEFLSVEATTTTTSTPVVVSHVTNSMLGIFNPPLSVVDGSTQTIQVDFDVEASYIDLGGLNAFLTPVVSAQVLASSAEALPLERLYAVVDAIDTTTDSFTANVRFQGGAVTGGGTIAIQCDGDTTHDDGSG